MVRKGNRDYTIRIETDDPSLFDLLPAEGPWEATMTNWTTTDKFEKQGSEGRSPLSDSRNQGGHEVAEG